MTRTHTHTLNRTPIRYLAAPRSSAFPDNQLAELGLELEYRVSSETRVRVRVRVASQERELLEAPFPPALVITIKLKLSTLTWLAKIFPFLVGLAFSGLAITLAFIFWQRAIGVYTLLFIGDGL